MMYFGAIYEDVLRQLQGNNYNPDDFGGIEYIEDIMKRREGYIKSRLPDYLLKMVEGEIKGQVIVEYATEGQTTGNYKIIQTASDLKLFKNWDKEFNPMDAYSDYILDSSLYTVNSDGSITFDSSVFSEGDLILANYTTNWSSTDGIQLLKQMLIDLVCYDLYFQGYGTEGDERWENRFDKIEEGLKAIYEGKLIPNEIASLVLWKDKKIERGIGKSFDIRRV